MKTIIAIGGSQIGPILADGTTRKNVPESIHKEILSRTDKKDPRILYIPTAKDDRDDYVAGFKYYYKKLGYENIDVLLLLNGDLTHAEIKAKIDAADIIFVNGGNTRRMMAWWKDYGVDKLLKAAYQRGVVMSGHSAGAICWFDYGNSDSFYKDKPFRVEALGIIPALLCPHYDSEPVRQEALEQMMKRTYRRVAIALDEAAAIEIIDDKYRILSIDGKSIARRTYWKQGEYIVETIAQTKEFKNLSQLLTKS